MTRRITVPEHHVALILPNLLADELMSFAQARRRSCLASAGRAKSNDMMAELRNEASIMGDLLLALLEAKEA